MTYKPFPSQSTLFTGWHFHKKETDLAALWESFKQGRYGPTHGRIDERQVEEYFERELLNPKK